MTGKTNTYLLRRLQDPDLRRYREDEQRRAWWYGFLTGLACPIVAVIIAAAVRDGVNLVTIIAAAIR